jgi:hypothetical protein
LDPGSYDVEISAFGYSDSTFQVSISEGTTAEESVVLPKLPSGTLTGVVTVDGAPLEHAEVRVLGTPLVVFTDNTGAYHFDSVPADTWSVECSRPGYGSTRAIVTVAADTPSDQFFGLSQTPASHFYPVALGDDAVWTSIHEDVLCDSPGARCGKWVPDRPNGSGGGEVQPGDDHGPGGGLAWVTGNGNTGNQQAVQDWDDVDRGSATLTSPAIPLGDGVFQNPILRYYRWYSKDVVNYPSGERLVVLISKDGQSWDDTLEVVDEKRNFWERKEFPLRSIVAEPDSTLPDAIWIRFIASETLDPLDTSDGPQDVDVVIEAAIDDIEIFEWDPATSTVEDPHVPAIAEVRLSHPNPLRIGGTIRVELSRNQPVQLDLIDVLGRRVRRLAKGDLGPGEIELRWDGRDDRGVQLPSGIYLLSLRAQGGNHRAKILLLR